MEDKALWEVSNAVGGLFATGSWGGERERELSSALLRVGGDGDLQRFEGEVGRFPTRSGGWVRVGFLASGGSGGTNYTGKGEGK